jgi:hypothetical protein
MSNTETIYGIEYQLPEVPDHTTIDNYELDKESQKFYITEAPSYFDELDFDEDGNPIYSEEQTDFVIAEWRKVNYGNWFFNNGVPVYLTGLHYFYLNYWTLEDGNPPDYRDADRRYFYFQDYSESLPHVFGIVRIKKRREGATSQATAYLVWKSITKRKSFCGIISKTGKDASDAFVYMVMNGYRNLPIFFKPRAEDDETKTELVFKKRKDNRRAKAREKGKIFDDDIGLESKINYKNTALNSYDSGRVTALLMDEAGKWPKEVQVNQYWPIVKKTLGRGAIKVGFCLIPSTANDAKSGGEPYKELFDGSSQFENQITATGLYRYFCPAYDGYEGFIDEYGISIIDIPTDEQKKFIYKKYGIKIEVGSKEYLLNQRRIITDKKALSEEIRMNPFTEEEAFMIDAKKCYFNSEKIYNQLDFLKEERVKLRRVRFFWKDNKTVDWADDDNGSWYIHKFPPTELQNKWNEINGVKTPANTDRYCNGIDPFKSSVISGKGSMGSCYVFEKLDMKDPNNTGLPIAEYVDRPRLKSLFHEEMLKASVFYGYKACYENDVGDDFVDYFSNKGFRSYLMKTPEAAIDRFKRRQGPSKYGVASSDAFALARQLDTCINYVENHCEKIYFVDLLEELLVYDHEHRTPFDRTVSFMISLLSGVSLESNKTEIKLAPLPVRTYKLDVI